MLALASGCRDGSSSSSEPLPPETLLARVLERATVRPGVAAQVAAGALTVTGTAALSDLARRGIGWASASGEPDAVEAIARSLGHRGERARLEAWLASASPETREAILAALLTARIEAGEVGPASREIDAIRDAERADAIRMALVRTHVGRGRLPAARAWVERIADQRLRDEGLVELVGAHGRAGRRREALAGIAAIASPFHRARAQGELARIDYARGRRRQAVDNAKLIEAKLVKAQVLANLARIAAVDGRAAEATRLFDRAEATARRLDDAFLRGSALADVARELEAAGRPRAAARVQDQIPPDNAAEVVAARVQRLVRRGALDEARAALLDLSVAGWIGSEAKATVAELEARRGELDAALDRTAAISVPAVRYRTLGRVAALDPGASVTPDRLEAVGRALRVL